MVPARRYNVLSVLTEGDTIHIVGMPGERFAQRIACGAIPQAHGAIPAPRNNPQTISAQGQRSDRFIILDKAHQSGTAEAFRLQGTQCPRRYLRKILACQAVGSKHLQHTDHRAATLHACRDRLTFGNKAPDRRFLGRVPGLTSEE